MSLIHTNHIRQPPSFNLKLVFIPLCYLIQKFNFFLPFSENSFFQNFNFKPLGQFYSQRLGRVSYDSLQGLVWSLWCFSIPLNGLCLITSTFIDYLKIANMYHTISKVNLTFSFFSLPKNKCSNFFPFEVSQTVVLEEKYSRR